MGRDVDESGALRDVDIVGDSVSADPPHLHQWGLHGNGDLLVRGLGALYVGVTISIHTELYFTSCGDMQTEV